MQKARIGPGRLCQKGKAQMATIGSEIGMIRRDERFVEQASNGQPGSSQHNRIDNMHNVGLKLVQTTQKQWAKEVELEFRIERERKSGSADDLSSGVPVHTAFRAE